MNFEVLVEFANSNTWSQNSEESPRMWLVHSANALIPYSIGTGHHGHTGASPGKGNPASILQINSFY